MRTKQESSFLPMTRRNMLTMMGRVVSGLPLLAGTAQDTMNSTGTAAGAGNEREKGEKQTQELQSNFSNQVIRTQLSPKWIRAYFGSELIANSRRALLLLEQGHTPVYYFPKQDVRMDLMTQTEHHTHCEKKGDASYYTLKVGSRVAENAVWYYPKPYASNPKLTTAPDLRGYVALYWKMMDAWYEEGEEVFGHPHDPYHRIDVLQSSRHVRAVVGGTTVAESRRPVLLFETGLQTRYYLPKEDVRAELLRPSSTVTICAYKGEAHYYSVAIKDRLFKDVAWYYRYPTTEVCRIANSLAFYSENEDVTLFVDGQEVPKSRNTGR